MKRSREELGRIHKEKCKELKQIRARMAEDLGVDLHQTECTYQGYCSGTCPKCRQEELMLNAALIKAQLEEADRKRRVAAVGLTTVAALCMTGCNPLGMEQVDGGMDVLPYETVEGNMSVPEELEGAVIGDPIDQSENATLFLQTEELEGDIAYSPEMELQGEIPDLGETGVEEP